MRAKILVMLAASAILASNAVLAAEKPGKPQNIKPSVHKVQSETWRDRALKARAEFAPAGAPSVEGTARARDERGDRRDGEESGGGRMRQDRGEGTDQGE